MRLLEALPDVRLAGECADADDGHGRATELRANIFHLLQFQQSIARALLGNERRRVERQKSSAQALRHHAPDLLRIEQADM